MSDPVRSFRHFREVPDSLWRWPNFSPAEIACRGTGQIKLHPEALDHPETIQTPQGPHHPLDPMAWAVLDVELAPWAKASMTLILAVGADRTSVIRSASDFRTERRREWARIQARARAEGELLRLGARGADPEIWEELLSQVLHPRSMAPIPRAAGAQLDLRQSSLWRWGISGDVPILLVEGDFENGSGLLGEVVRAQRWC